jgi:hypothetical protein
MRNARLSLNRRSKLQEDFEPRVVKLVVNNSQEECATVGSAERKRQLSAAIVELDQLLHSAEVLPGKTGSSGPIPGIEASRPGGPLHNLGHPSAALTSTALRDTPNYLCKAANSSNTPAACTMAD